MVDTGDPVTGLANLAPAEPGNTRAVKHGAHSERLVGPIASDVEGEVEALCAGTPAGEPQFGAHSERLVGPIASDVEREVEALCAGTPAGEPQFAAARAVLARKLARLRMVGEYLEANHDGSPLTHKGGVLKAAQFELSLLASVEKSLTDLGLNPSAAAKLGVELVRGSSIAEELAAARQIRVRADEVHSAPSQELIDDTEGRS